MGLKYIIDSDAVIQRMGLPNVDGVAESIDSHLTAAHVRFQGLLDTTFEPVTRTDLFKLTSGKYPMVPDGYFRLRLRKGFVKAESITVKAAAGPDMGSAETLTFPNYSIDLEKGIVYVAEAFEDKYVSVLYSAGFDSTNKAPDWLKEAVLAYMPYLMNTQQSTNRAKEQEGVVKKVADVSADMMLPYLRGTAYQYRPIF